MSRIYKHPSFIQYSEILLESKPSRTNQKIVVSKLINTRGNQFVDIRKYQDGEPTGTGIFFPVHLIDMIEEGFRLAEEQPAEDPPDDQDPDLGPEVELTSTPGRIMSYDEVCRILEYNVFEDDAPREKKKHK